jgi:voltage-gated potassium channel
LATLLTWAVFTADYAARLYLADDRKRWFRTHLVDLAIVLLPLLRPLRLLRLVVLIGVLQNAVGRAIRGKVVIYTVSGAILLVYVASLAVLQAERGQPDAHITDFGDAIWWAITTITTVGYGDMYPVTTTGRVIAALLMIGGISLVGSITATIASWIVQSVAADESAEAAVTAAHINELRAEIASLREELRAPVVEGSGPDHRS